MYGGRIIWECLAPTNSGSSGQFHLVKASIEESVDVWLVKGQLLNLPPVVQAEVHQVFARSC